MEISDVFVSNSRLCRDGDRFEILRLSHTRREIQRRRLSYLKRDDLEKLVLPFALTSILYSPGGKPARRVAARLGESARCELKPVAVFVAVTVAPLAGARPR